MNSFLKKFAIAYWGISSYFSSIFSTALILSKHIFLNIFGISAQLLQKSSKLPIFKVLFFSNIFSREISFFCFSYFVIGLPSGK
jgi:hypothetical protein